MTAKRTRLAVILGAALAIVAGAVVWTLTKRPPATLPPAPRSSLQATSAELGGVAGLRVFFGHQSVGKNIMDGVPDLYTSRGLPVPTIAELARDDLSARGPAETGLLHAYVGENRFPLRKLEDFGARLRAGLAQDLDVAVLKFCYLDVDSSTDVDALFESYRSEIASLETEFPEVTFLYSTVPLRTEATDLKEWVKEVIGRPNDNAARERFNRLVREEYGSSERLFDIAAFQSTTPDGARVTRSHWGVTHFALYDGYASDPGHLNAEASVLAAGEFLGLVARAVAP